MQTSARLFFVRLIATSIWWLSASLCLAQSKDNTDLHLEAGDAPPIRLAYRPMADIKIDGALDEPAWSNITPVTEFASVDPDTLLPGELPTRMYMFYTDRGFYLGAEMEQDPATLLERLTGRDQGMLNRDYVAFTLDTSGEARYGFWFQVSLGDSVADGTILPEQQYSTSWDGAWYRASKRTDLGWNAEIFVPWSLVSMPKNDGVRPLGIFLSRRVAYLNERWSWPPLAFTESKFFSRFQKLEVENVSPKQQWSLFPYAATTIDNVEDTTNVKAGAEVFWRPSTNFQATASINPDFGNVEADDVIVNFSANEVFFPEKRLFFQEGQEIFATSPRADARRNRNPLTLVNTRRIGGRSLSPDIPDDVTIEGRELTQPTELLGAFKVTGQVGQLRYGLLGAFEDDIKFDGVGDNGNDVNLEQDGRNYAAARILYESNLRGAYLATGWLSTAVTHPERDAYVNAIDLHYYSPDRVFSTDAQFISSNVRLPANADEAASNNRGYGGFADFRYVPRKGKQHNLAIEYFDKNLEINDLGFQRRVDLYSSRYSFSHTRSGLQNFQSTRTSGFMGVGWNTDNRLVLAGFNLRQELLLKSLNRIQYNFGLSPARYEDRNSFGNGTYRIDDRWEARASFNSNNTRRLAFNGSTAWQQEDIGGDRITYEAGLTWRISNRMTTEFSLRYRDRSAWLLHTGEDTFATFRAKEWAPRFNLDFFPSARQQIRIALHWVAIRATERDLFSIPVQPGELLARVPEVGAASEDFTVSRINFQIRYRWEIAPLSDLFLVYTKNATLPSTPGASFGDLFSDGFDSATAEQLVLKLRYRLGS